MVDRSGKIIKDSLIAFYKLVDTTHLQYTIACDAWCYEWAGANFIEARQINVDSIECFTSMNSATHCSLVLIISKGYCNPRIDLESIASPGIKTYRCDGGHIKIDRKLWAQNIIKAAFNFTFYNSDEPGKPMFWKGVFVTQIVRNR